MEGISSVRTNKVAGEPCKSAYSAQDLFPLTVDAHRRVHRRAPRGGLDRIATGHAGATILANTALALQGHFLGMKEGEITDGCPFKVQKIVGGPDFWDKKDG